MTERSEPLVDAIDTTRRLIELTEKKAVTMRQLLRCLLLAQLLGLAPNEMRNPLRTGFRVVEHRTLQRWRGMVLSVTYDGETKDFPLLDVPEELWPEDVLNDYRRYRQSQPQRKGKSI